MYSSELYFVLHFIVGNVNFEQSTYNVFEDSGPAQPVLILSNPSSTDMKIQITRFNDQATLASGMHTEL